MHICWCCPGLAQLAVLGWGSEPCREQCRCGCSRARAGWGLLHPGAALPRTAQAAVSALTPDVLNVQHLATRFFFLNIFSTPSCNLPPALAVLSRGDLQQVLGSEGLGRGHAASPAHQQRAGHGAILELRTLSLGFEFKDFTVPYFWSVISSCFRPSEQGRILPPG